MHALFVPQRVLMATPAVTSARAFLSTTGVTATWTAPTVATKSEIAVRFFFINSWCLLNVSLSAFRDTID